MRFRQRFPFAVFLLLVSVVAWAQTSSDRTRPASILARLSFHSSQGLDFPEKSFTQICFSVTRDGHYQLRRVSAKAYAQILEGALSLKEFQQLGRLLGNAEIRALEGGSGGLLRNSAETFRAEIQREDGVQRIVLSDADGNTPFPSSVSRIVAWLQAFEAEGAKPVDVDAQDICPGGALQPVRPVTARLEGFVSTGACVAR